MILTKEQIKADDLCWNDRKIKAELKYCGFNVLHRKQVTNQDLRFYAYIARRAHEMIEKLEAQPESSRIVIGKSKGGTTLWYKCEKCEEPVNEKDNYCCGCGRRLIHEIDH